MSRWSFRDEDNILDQIHIHMKSKYVSFLITQIQAFFALMSESGNEGSILDQIREQQICLNFDNDDLIFFGNDTRKCILP